MTAPQPIQHSARLSKAAAAERARLQRELERVNRTATGLRERLSQAEETIKETQQRLALLDQLVGEPEMEPAEVIAFPTATTDPPNGLLRGANIRLVAVRLLASQQSSSDPIHYTDWVEMVEDAGFGIAGRDPAANFLTQIIRSPVVARTDEPGMYVLDLDAPDRLAERLNALNRELGALHEGQQTIEAITTTSRRRSELISEIARVERELTEALEALGAVAPS